MNHKIDFTKINLNINTKQNLIDIAMIPLKNGLFSDVKVQFRKNSFEKHDNWLLFSQKEEMETFYDTQSFRTYNFEVPVPVNSAHKIHKPYNTKLAQVSF